MAEWVLILWLSAPYKGGVVMHDFSTQARCEAAGKTAVARQNNVSQGSGYYICVER